MSVLARKALFERIKKAEKYLDETKDIKWIDAYKKLVNELNNFGYVPGEFDKQTEIVFN